SVLDENGKELSNEKFLSTNDALDEFLDRFEDAKFVLESTGIWEFIYEGIERRGFEAVLAHPLKVRAIAEAKIKTDKVEARTLAHLLRADLVPCSYIPSKDIRDLRQLVRQRTFLVQRQTSFKNKVHAEMTRRGIRRPDYLKTPFSNKSIEWMRSLNIVTININLDCIQAIQDQIESMNEKLYQEYQKRPEAQLISSFPGIGYYGALLIWAEIADIHRFKDPEHLSSYAGLTPTVSQSASTVHYGAISKEGSKHLRWILIESVHVHIRYNPDSQLSKFHSKIEKKKGNQRATTAAARKLLHVLFWMLQNNEPYHSHGFNPVRKPAAQTA
ncbi:MAG: IS110 family transposase, partial [Methanomassiliicoccales archaeon]